MSIAEDQHQDQELDRRSPSVSDRGALTLGLFWAALGWLLFWAGLDKLFGLGFLTESGGAVINGASATEGYLTYGLAPDSLAADVLGPLSGNPIVDTLYLLATLGAGLALMLGVCVRLAAIGGAILFLLLWFTAFPLDYNPFLDQHLFYALSCLLVLTVDAGRRWGVGGWWRATSLVRARPWLA